MKGNTNVYRCFILQKKKYEKKVTEEKKILKFFFGVFFLFNFQHPKHKYFIKIVEDLENEEANNK
ncbi:MAG: hypothetical protein IJH63_10075 [Methanobrevibacter sp.]|nr:hypothetical protein [Methanobrevibacter sp.]